jgi:hypothetical protein
MPQPFFTPEKTRYPLYRRLGGLQGRSGQVRKISPPPGFDHQTVQPVASHYIDYANRTHTEIKRNIINYPVGLQSAGRPNEKYN